MAGLIAALTVGGTMEGIKKYKNKRAAKRASRDAPPDYCIDEYSDGSPSSSAPVFSSFEPAPAYPFHPRGSLFAAERSTEEKMQQIAEEEQVKQLQDQDADGEDSNATPLALAHSLQRTVTAPAMSYQHVRGLVDDEILPPPYDAPSYGDDCSTRATAREPDVCPLSLIAEGNDDVLIEIDPAHQRLDNRPSGRGRSYSTTAVTTGRPCRVTADGRCACGRRLRDRSPEAPAGETTDERRRRKARAFWKLKGGGFLSLYGYGMSSYYGGGYSINGVKQYKPWDESTWPQSMRN